MKPRRLKLVFGFMSYGGNGGLASEHPSIRDWIVPNVLSINRHAEKEGKFEPLDWIEGQDYLDVADTPVTMVRNRIIYWAKHEAKADILVMIDSDNMPDVGLGFDSNAKPFIPTSFDFLYKHYDKGPILVAAPYSGPPYQHNGVGNANIYAFRWRNGDNLDPTVLLRMDQYTREEAAEMTGIAQAAAVATGCIMLDLRLFDHLPYPWCEYEFRGEQGHCETCHQSLPGPRTHKCSTEDVVLSRNIQLVIWKNLGYNPVYINWDAWAGHWKPQCVGKPVIATIDQIGRHFLMAEKARPSTQRMKVINPAGLETQGIRPEQAPIAIINDPNVNDPGRAMVITSQMYEDQFGKKIEVYDDEIKPKKRKKHANNGSN